MMKRPSWLSFGGSNARAAQAAYDRCSHDAGVRAAEAAMIQGDWTVLDLSLIHI